MTTKYEKDAVYKGKVTGIQPYGAFIGLDDQTQGLVHISEIMHGYVKDIHDVLAVGDDVTVKVLNNDEESGKISLSMKAIETPPTKSAPKEAKQSAVKIAPEPGTEGFNTLKEKLEEWIKQSERNDFIHK